MALLWVFWVLVLILGVDGLSCLVGELGESFGAPVGVAGGGCDFGVAHHGFAGVFWRAGFGEVGAEEVAGGAHGDVWEAGVFQCSLPAQSFDVVGQRVPLSGEQEAVGLAFGRPFV